MIKNFTVGNFQSFRDKNTLCLERQANDDSLKESFFTNQKTEFLRSVAIYGANASGKSNLWKALLFFRQFITNSLQSSLVNEKIQVMPFLLNTKTENEPSFFEVEIYAGKKRFQYGFEVSSKKVHKEWLFEFPNKKKLFERTNDEIDHNPIHFKEATADLKKMTRPNVLFLTVLASYNAEISREVVKEIQKIEVMSGNLHGSTLDYSVQKYREYQKEILDFMKEADFGITDLTIDEKEVSPEELIKNLPLQFRQLVPVGQEKMFQRTIKTSHSKFKPDGTKVGDVSFDFSQESTGTQHFFALSAPFINTLKEGKVLIVDELDASLHPFLCRFILKLFNSNDRNKNNAQLIFTTHDVSLLENEILRRDQVWFTEKDKFGVSELYSLAELGERKEASFGKRYLEGRYGALPYIHYLEDTDQIE